MTTPQQETPTGGEITITDRAVQRIAAAAAASVPGTVATGGGFDRITGMSYPRFDTQIDRLSKVVSIEAVIAISWPAPATEVARKVRTAIATWVHSMTGFDVRSVNVVVGNVVDGERRVTPQAVAAAPVQPFLQTIRVVPFAEVQAPGCRRVPAQLSSAHELPIKVSPERPLAAVHVAAEQRLTEVSVAPEQPLREVHTQPSPEIAEVHTAPERPLQEISVPAQPELREVHAKELAPLKQVGVARPAPLVEVHAPKPAEPYSPQAPKKFATVAVRTARPIPLRKIRTREAPLRPVRTTQTRLRPVRVLASAKPLSPTVPVHSDPYKPSVPPELPLKSVEIRPLFRQARSYQEGGRRGRKLN